MARSSAKPTNSDDPLAGLGVASSPKPSSSKGAKKDPVLTAGLRRHAALAKIQNEVKSLLDASPVREVALTRFVAESRAKGRAGDKSYPGFEGDATASIQLRKKDNRSNLSVDVVALCNDLAITVEHYVIVPKAVIVNPKYMGENDSLAELIAMVKKAGLPTDFLQLQNEVSRMIPCDETLDDIFALGPNHSNERVTEILQMVAGPTISAKWNGTLAEAVDLVRDELVPPQASHPQGVPPAGGAANGGEAKAADAPKAGSSGLMDQLKASLAAEDAVKGGGSDGSKGRKRA